MDPFTGIVSAVGGLLGLASASQTNEANLAATNYTNAANERMVRETNLQNARNLRAQLDQQESQFQRQMEYNSIGERVRQLRAAGLNPALAFGDAAQSASASSVPSASPAASMQYETPVYSDVFNSVMQSAVGIGGMLKDVSEAQGINIDNQSRYERNRAQLNETLATINKLMEDKKLSGAQRSVLDTTRAKLQSEVDFLNKSQTDSLEQLTLQNQQIRMQTTVLREQAANFAADTAYKKSMTALNGMELNFKPALLHASISELMSRISLNASQKNLNEQLSESEIRKQWTEVLRAKGLSLSNKENEAVMPYVIDNVKNVERMSWVNSYNPAYYAGQVLGGAGAAVIRKLQ